MQSSPKEGRRCRSATRRVRARLGNDACPQASYSDLLRRVVQILTLPIVQRYVRAKGARSERRPP